MNKNFYVIGPGANTVKQFLSQLKPSLDGLRKIGCFGNMHKCIELENSLSYCILRSELHRSEHSLKTT